MKIAGFERVHNNVQLENEALEHILIADETGHFNHNRSILRPQIVCTKNTTSLAYSFFFSFLFSAPQFVIGSPALKVSHIDHALKNKKI